METRKKGGKGIGLVLVILLFFGAVANAELLTIAIEGVVDSVGDSQNVLGGAISVGDTITGYYKYDTSAVDRNSSDDTGIYLWEAEPYGIYLEINGISFMTDPEDAYFVCYMYNDCGQDLSDSFQIESFTNITSLDRVSIENIVWNLYDPSDSVFDSDVLLHDAPDLGFNWRDNLISIGLDSRNGISGHVTSAYIIPEPITIILFGLGGLFLRRNSH